MTKYQYAMIVNTGQLAVPEVVERSNQDQVAEQLTRTFGAVTSNVEKALSNLEPGDWEIVSHTVSFYGTVAVLSFLVRREA